MKQQFVTAQCNNRLILIFAGWGMSANPFSDISLDGYDIMVVWDYTDTGFDTAPLARYKHIYLFAWSFGVYMAALTIEACNLNPTLAIAVNGSPFPINDSKGIPHAIFDGTLNGLSPRNVDKFYNRMCSSREEFMRFMSHAPGRSLDNLKDELSAIGSRAGSTPAPDIKWDRIIIAENDRIFPVDNLRQAWKDNHRVRSISSGHLPDWQKLIEQEIIDKQLVKEKFNRSAPDYDANATVQHKIATELWRLWRNATPHKPLSILEVGYGTGLLTRLYTDAWHPYRLSLWDLAPQPFTLPEAGEIIAGDAEELITTVPDSFFEAIASSSCMQWFDSPKAFMREAARATAPGGIIALSTFGPDNMREITGLTGMPLRYYSVDEIRDMIPDCCRILEIKEQHLTLTFTSPRLVMSHLRNTGVNAIRHAGISTKEFLSRYPVDSDGAGLTYHPIYIILKRTDNE